MREYFPKPNNKKKISVSISTVRFNGVGGSVKTISLTIYTAINDGFNLKKTNYTIVLPTSYRIPTPWVIK